MMTTISLLVLQSYSQIAWFVYVISWTFEMHENKRTPCSCCATQLTPQNPKLSLQYDKWEGGEGKVTLAKTVQSIKTCTVGGKDKQGSKKNMTTSDSWKLHSGAPPNSLGRLYCLFLICTQGVRLTPLPSANGTARTPLSLLQSICSPQAALTLTAWRPSKPKFSKPHIDLHVSQRHNLFDGTHPSQCWYGCGFVKAKWERE